MIAVAGRSAARSVAVNPNLRPALHRAARELGTHWAWRDWPRRGHDLAGIAAWCKPCSAAAGPCAWRCRQCVRVAALGSGSWNANAALRLDPSRRTRSYAPRAAVSRFERLHTLPLCCLNVGDGCGQHFHWSGGEGDPGGRSAWAPPTCGVSVRKSTSGPCQRAAAALASPRTAAQASY